MKSKIIILGIICLLYLVCSDDAVGPDPSFQIPTIYPGPPAASLVEFEQILEDMRKKMYIPAYSAAIVKDRSIVWAKGFGYADPKNNVRATPRTCYHLASITKSMASTVIMQLVNEGFFSLEDHISTYGIDLENADSIRIKHLFSHTSAGEPGRTFEYDGNRFSYLDQVIEQATGKTFGEHFVTRVIKPLDLTDTAPNIWDFESFGLTGYDLGTYINKMARAYWLDGKTTINYASYFGTAAGLISSVIDVAKYTIAIGNHTLLDADSQNLIFSPQIYIRNHETAYGFGWFIQSYRDEQLIWHGGSWDGTSCFLVKVPARELTFVILANSQMLQRVYPQMRNDGDITYSAVVCEFLNAFVFGEAQLPDEPWED